MYFSVCFQGMAGEQGAPGHPGYVIYPEAKTIIGEKGNIGEPGFPGREGAVGEPGPPGADGKIGPTGWTGLKVKNYCIQLRAK